MRKVDPIFLQTLLRYFKAVNVSISDKLVGAKVRVYYRMSEVDGISIAIYEGRVVAGSNNQNNHKYFREYALSIDRKFTKREIDSGLPIRLEREKGVDKEHLILFDDYQGISWWLTYA